MVSSESVEKPEIGLCEPGEACTQRGLGGRSRVRLCRACCPMRQAMCNNEFRLGKLSLLSSLRVSTWSIFASMLPGKCDVW